MSKLLFFTAPWCAPCKAMKPIAEAVCQDTSTELEYVDVDTTEGARIASKHGVRGVPSLVTVDESGKQLDGLIGMKTVTQVRNLIVGGHV